MSLKENLIGEQFVKGNIKNFLQTYNIYYYPPEQNFPTDKIRLSLFGKENGEPRMIRSLYFENVENYRNFILNNIFSYIHWLEKKGIEYKPIEMSIRTFRITLLDDLLMRIRKEIPEKWQKNLQKIKLTINR